MLGVLNREFPLMKTILFAALACVFLMPIFASAQINPKLLPGRWSLVSSSPSLEEQVVDYAKVAGYSPARTKELVDEIREMKKSREPQLLRIDESAFEFEGVEVFGARGSFSYTVDGSQVKVQLQGLTGKGGAGDKAEKLVPEFFVGSVTDKSLTLKSGPIEGFGGKSISYKFARFTRVIGEMREWQAPGGKTFRAKVVDYKGGTAVLMNEDGKKLTVSASKIHPDDKAYLLELIEESK